MISVITTAAAIAIVASGDLKPHPIGVVPAVFAERPVCEAGAVVRPRAVRLRNLRSLGPAAACLVFRDILLSCDIKTRGARLSLHGEGRCVMASKQSLSFNPKSFPAKFGEGRSIGKYRSAPYELKGRQSRGAHCFAAVSSTLAC